MQATPTKSMAFLPAVCARLASLRQALGTTSRPCSGFAALALSLVPLFPSRAHATEDDFMLVDEPVVMVQVAQASSSPPALTEEQVYQSYDSARAMLTGLMRKATSRIILATRKLGDGDIATLIHSMQLRGKQALVVIDRKGKTYYKSRHEYLIKATVPVYFTSLGSVVPKDRSLVILDDTTIEIGADLDPSWSGPVVVRPSRYTPDELVQAINSRGSLERAILGKPAPPKTRSGAKPSTSAPSSPSKNGTIGGGVKLKARSAGGESRALPRSLPRKTVLGDILSGSRDAEEPVVPVRSVQEELLKLDNERDLRAD